MYNEIMIIISESHDHPCTTEDRNGRYRQKMAKSKQTIFVAFSFSDDFLEVNQDNSLQMWYEIKVHVVKNGWISKVGRYVYD